TMVTILTPRGSRPHRRLRPLATTRRRTAGANPGQTGGHLTAAAVTSGATPMAASTPQIGRIADGGQRAVRNSASRNERTELSWRRAVLTVHRRSPVNLLT